MKQKFLFYLIIGLLSIQQSFAQQIVINEIQYTNRVTCTDSLGNTPDWIEIYNKGNTPVNLSGYCLTDRKNETEKGILPDLTLKPQDYLLVFASGNSIQTENELHLDFKLKIMEDTVYLLNPYHEVIDFKAPECVPPDNSLGRYPDGGESFSVLTASPSYSNNNSEIIELNYRKDTLFINQEGGFYKNSIEIELTNSCSDNQIFYSLNGDSPDDKAILYNGIFQLNDINENENRFANQCDAGIIPGNKISKANILRAQVYSHGCPASNEISGSYFISDQTVFDYEVPIVSIITDKNNLFDDEEGIYVKGNYENYNRRGKEWERPIHLEIFDDKEKILTQGAGMRIHGRGSRAGAQKSLKIYARDEYGKTSFELPILSQKPYLNEFKTLLIRATRDWTRTLFKDEMSGRIVENMNLDYAASETVILFLNGEYWGIYSLREKQDIDYVRNNYDPDIEHIDIIGHNNSNISVNLGTIEEYKQMISWLEMNDPENENFLTDISEIIDIDCLIDYFIAQFYLANTDFPDNNLELWKSDSENSKWRYFFFDLDAVMIQIGDNRLATFIDKSKKPFQISESSLYILSRLFENQEFRMKFQIKFIKHLNTTFAPNRMIKLINDYQELYNSLVVEHIYRWKDPSDYHKWLSNVDMLKDFAIQRPFVLKQLMDEYIEDPVAVYPNPSCGNIVLEIPDLNTEVNYSIYDISGKRLVNETQYVNNSISINLNLKTGIYILRVEFSGCHFYKKLSII